MDYFTVIIIDNFIFFCVIFEDIAIVYDLLIEKIYPVQ